MELSQQAEKRLNRKLFPRLSLRKPLIFLISALKWHKNSLKRRSKTARNTQEKEKGIKKYKL